MYTNPQLSLDLARYREREIAAQAARQYFASEPRRPGDGSGRTAGRAWMLSARGLTRRRALVAATAGRRADRAGSAGRRGSAAAVPQRRPR